MFIFPLFAQDLAIQPVSLEKKVYTSRLKARLEKQGFKKGDKVLYLKRIDNKWYITDNKDLRIEADARIVNKTTERRSTDGGTNAERLP